MNSISRGKPEPRHSFIVFSDDWGEHPSSCQHIFKYIASKYRVLWVNTIGMRNPTLSAGDFRKIMLKTRKMFSTEPARKTGTRPPLLSVCQPPMLPFSNVSIIRRLNQASVIKTVNRLRRRLQMNDPVLVTTVPNACDYVGHLQEKKVVYYCVDDFSEWPGLEKSLVLDMEKKLVSKADVFIATSQKLYDRLSASGKPVHLLTHGVEVDFFRNLPSQEHPLLKNISEPRIGYFGLFDDRSDRELLAETARRLPDVSFVVTGKIETDISSLDKLKNFYFTGPVPYAELPAMLSGWDICMLPYRINELTSAIQPLKLKEYLASGRPVISTPIPEAEKLKSMVHIAASPEEWKDAIRDLLQKRNHLPSQTVLNFLKKEDWQYKAGVFLDISLTAA